MLGNIGKIPARIKCEKISGNISGNTHARTWNTHVKKKRIEVTGTHVTYVFQKNVNLQNVYLQNDKWDAGRWDVKK